VKVAVLENLEQWKSIDLCDFDQVRTFKVKNATSIKQSKAVVEEAFKIPIARQRYWKCPNRRNRTVRPDEPISPREEEAGMPPFSSLPLPTPYTNVGEVGCSSGEVLWGRYAR
jgi:hypothetical protein